METLNIERIKEISQIIRQPGCWLPEGGRSKPSLSHPPEGCETISMASISGITAYDPSEYTISALAGTPLSEIQRSLRQNGQYLPFDPPFARQGATIGGTVASGLNGPGRYRYGGMRDFLLAIQFIDGNGDLVKAGGKVVKNASGFDLPKLMIGSLGRLGILVELTFKVFPLPQAFATLRVEFSDLAEALVTHEKFYNSQLDINSLELDVHAEQAALSVQVAGSIQSIQARQARLMDFLGKGEIIPPANEEYYWESRRNFSWVPEGWGVVKVPLTPGRIFSFNEAIRGDEHLSTSKRVFSGGGQQAWIAFANDERYFSALSSLVTRQQLSGLVVKGSVHEPRLGLQPGHSFLRRVKLALDPHHRFPEI